MSTPTFVQLSETHGKPVHINGAHVIAIRPTKIYTDDGERRIWLACCEIVTIDGSIYVNGNAEEIVRAFEKSTRS